MHNSIRVAKAYLAEQGLLNRKPFMPIRNALKQGVSDGKQVCKPGFGSLYLPELFSFSFSFICWTRFFIAEYCDSQMIR